LPIEFLAFQFFEIVKMTAATTEELTELQIAGIGAIVLIMDDPANLELYQQAFLTSGCPFQVVTHLIGNSFKNYRIL
jgi:hypothetical protein